MMFKKQHLIPALLLGFLSTVFAQDVELNPAHPDTYVVQKGDSLWNIAQKFKGNCASESAIRYYFEIISPLSVK